MNRLLLSIVFLSIGCTTHTQLGSNDDNLYLESTLKWDIIPLEGQGQFKRTYFGSVKTIFNESMLVGVEYVPVAGIRVIGTRSRVTQSYLIEEMKVVAADAGADALFILDFQETVDEAQLHSLRDERRPSTATAEAWSNVFGSLLGVKSRDQRIKDSYLLVGTAIAIKLIQSDNDSPSQKE